MILIAIDPGCAKSAVVEYDGSNILMKAQSSNEAVLALCLEFRPAYHYICAIEKVESMGMAVGAEVFETVYWSGRFAQAFGAERVDRITRREVKLHLCGSMQAKDKNVRQALIDKFGGNQSIKKGGPLYKVAGDEWSALAVAITWWEKRRTGVREVRGAA